MVYQLLYIQDIMKTNFRGLLLDGYHINSTLSLSENVEIVRKKGAAYYIFCLCIM